MASFSLLDNASLISILLLLVQVNSIDIYHEWIVTLETTSIYPVSYNQPVIKINGMFPGPLINATTNDVVYVNVFNNMDEPLLFTWNGLQQWLNSWQDGVSGTNCAIEPGNNWTYVLETKDQIGTFTYFPSINFQKAAGGFGPIRINDRDVNLLPFPKPEAEFDLLIGDWNMKDYQHVRIMLQEESFSHIYPGVILMNGKGPYGCPNSTSYESFNVKKGMTYRLRISNVGSIFSLNFRIQKHKMVIVETEGFYTNQIVLDSLDVHVGQSYSVLITANQDEADYYMIASPKLYNVDRNEPLVAKGILHYENSILSVQGPIPAHPFDIDFSLNQAKSIRSNMSIYSRRPNPQGTLFQQTFILEGSRALILGVPSYVVNNISYLTPNTPLKLADHFRNGSGVYRLNQFPVLSVNDEAKYGVFVAEGVHKSWLEIVFKNDVDDEIDSWHLNGFGLYVLGFGKGKWTPESRNKYNIYDPIVRSTVQVYPKGWTAVYVFLDNPGIWNLRSQNLVHWYMGQELYLRVHDDDDSNPPQNLLLCGIFGEASVRLLTGEASPPEASAPAPQEEE